MSEFSWPEDPGLDRRAGLAWAATVARLPIGAALSGTVLARQPFGVFFTVDDVPDAVALAELPTCPSRASRRGSGRASRVRSSPTTTPATRSGPASRT
ncbi:hypothetical protein [Amycolatopsis sp. NPDC051903]|uniref:hypothetical protein n=1 Tax=Amycolatopsis sp. NPDC051903 TaxID=3363936 RepID=UPI00378B8332